VKCGTVDVGYNRECGVYDRQVRLSLRLIATDSRRFAFFLTEADSVLLLHFGSLSSHASPFILNPLNQYFHSGDRSALYYLLLVGESPAGAHESRSGRRHPHRSQSKRLLHGARLLVKRCGTPSVE
jgi:hypothetical protein